MNRNDARKIIDGLMIEYPTLTSSGWGQPSNEKFQEYRDQLRTEFFVYEFVHAMAYIAQAKRTKAVNHKMSSYTFKHAAESWGENEPTRLACKGYVGNGAFIAAAIASNLQVRRYHNASDCYVNLASVRLC